METEYPGFFKCVDDSVLHEGKLKIPKDFCENFDVKVPHQCHLETSFGSWLVGLERTSGEFIFKKGWMEFVVGNGLKPGEHVVFEYTGHANFDVEIYGQDHCRKRSTAKETHKLHHRESDDHDVISVSSDSDSDSEMPLSSDNSLESEIKSPRASGFQKNKRAIILATINRFGNPCFSMKIFQTHVTKGPLLTPRRFMRNIYKPKKVELQVGNRAGQVNWSHPFPKSSMFSGGWVRFVRQNELQEGDTCDFELISKTFEVAVMKVSIRRDTSI